MRQETGQRGIEPPSEAWQLEVADDPEADGELPGSREAGQCHDAMRETRGDGVQILLGKLPDRLVRAVCEVAMQADVTRVQLIAPDRGGEPADDRLGAGAGDGRSAIRAQLHHAGPPAERDPCQRKGRQQQLRRKPGHQRQAHERQQARMVALEVRKLMRQRCAQLEVAKLLHHAFGDEDLRRATPGDAEAVDLIEWDDVDRRGARR